MLRTALDHPKLLKLCRVLGLAKYEAVGLLETLWQFTARFAPQGDIGRFSDEEIGRWIGVERIPEMSRIFAGLIASGWLDESSQFRLVVHDWEDHADRSVRRILERRGLRFISDGQPHEWPAMGGQCQAMAGQKPAMAGLPGPGPEPEPEPGPGPEPGPVGIANAGEAPAAERPKKRGSRRGAAPETFFIPKPIVEAARPLGLVSLCGRALRDGYEPRRVLAWVLRGESYLPHKPAAWFAEMLSSGGWPGEDYADRAKTLLEARDAQIGAENPPPPEAERMLREISAHMTPEREESFAKRKNRAMRELLDAQKAEKGKSRV